MRILYITTISNTINAFLVPHIKMLVDKGYRVDIACNIQQELDLELERIGCNVYHISFQRTPFSLKNIKAMNDIRNLIIQNKYDAVHTHTPVASVVSRVACRKIKHIKVIYTCHGFNFCKDDTLINWALFYPIEKIISRHTDTIITINNEDFEVAKKFEATEVHKISGIGLDIKKFKMVKDDFNRSEKRKELGFSKEDVLICSVGELSKRKNHKIALRAISEMKNPRVKFVICGEGDDQSLRKISREYGISDQLILLGKRDDIAEVLKASDIFVFPSLREGLGIAAIEAMAVGTPVVASNRHGILEYAINEVTALTCNPKNYKEFKHAFLRLITDKRLVEKLTHNAYQMIDKFELKNSLEEMDKIYDKVLHGSQEKIQQEANIEMKV